MNIAEPARFNKKFLESARECASYIFDSEKEQKSYQEFIQEGHDPREHILYHASLVLGKEDEFNIDIIEYQQIEDQWTNNT